MTKIVLYTLILSALTFGACATAVKKVHYPVTMMADSPAFFEGVAPKAAN